MSFEMLFDDGFQALCRASYSQNYHQCTTLGNKGAIEIRGGVREDGRLGNVFTQSNGTPNPKALFHNRREIPAGQTLQQAVLLDAFATTIKNGDKTFKTPGEMGLRDIRIAEAVYASAAEEGVSIAL